jgi:hypothetical protein
MRGHRAGTEIRRCKRCTAKRVDVRLRERGRDGHAEALFCSVANEDRADEALRRLLEQADERREHVLERRALRQHFERALLSGEHHLAFAPPRLIAPHFADIDEHVNRARQFPALVVERNGVRFGGHAAAVGTLDDDIRVAIFAAFTQAPRHPAVVVRNRPAIRGEQVKGAAVAVGGIAQLGFAAPRRDGALIEIRDQPIGVARIRRGRKDCQHAAKVDVAAVAVRRRERDRRCRGHGVLRRSACGRDAPRRRRG